MKENKPSTEVLIAPQLAVQRYLDELLQEATLHVETISETETIEDANISLKDTESEGVAELDEVTKHQQQDELVSQEIENEDDIFAAFEFAVAALEHEAEDIGPTDVAIGDNDVSEGLAASTSPDVDNEIETLKASVSLKTQVVEAESISEPHLDAEISSKEETAIEPLAASDKTQPLPWAENRFECLLFNVGGLKMAVPLVELGGIQKADHEKVTKIFGQPDWFIGVSSVNDLRIRTVDTARWVMPNHYKGELHDSFKFIIQLDRSSWGLACEDVAEAISLEPSEVKWRSDRSKRPWLAGTVIDHMCAILDVQGFIELLDDPSNGFKAHLK